MAKNITHPEWYQKKRACIRDAFKIGKPKMHLSKTIDSPSGKYSLETTPYEIKKGGWDYCEGKIYNNIDDEYLISVYRNYGHFPYTWLEGHPKGDFLICGEDYQGITIVDLIKGRNYSWINDSAEKGNGFCSSSFYISPEMNKIAICGCFWGGPYEILFMEFPKNDPTDLPWKEINYVDTCVIDSDNNLEEDFDIIGWDTNDYLVFSTKTDFYDKDNRITVDDKVSELYSNGKTIEEACKLYDEKYHQRTNIYYLDVKTGERRLGDTEWNFMNNDEAEES